MLLIPGLNRQASRCLILNAIMKLPRERAQIESITVRETCPACGAIVTYEIAQSEAAICSVCGSGVSRKVAITLPSIRALQALIDRAS